MSIKLKLLNPVLTLEERSYLDADYSSGTSLTVKNNDGFTANKYVVVGEPGQETTEEAQVASTTGNTTVTISAILKFSHGKSTPIYYSDWNKIDVVRAPTLTGTYVSISGSPFDIEWDDGDLKTTIIDTEGDSTYFYKYRFNNSATATYSAYSGAISGAGLSKNTAGFVLKKIRRSPLAVGVSDEAIYEFMSDFQDLVYEEMPKAWWFEREGTPVSTTSNIYKYSISANWSDFLSLKMVLYRYISGSVDNTYPLTKKTELEFRNLKADSTQSSNDSVSAYALLPPDSSSAKGYIGIHSTPATTACYIIPVYEIELSAIETFDDTLVVPHIRGYEAYVKYRICSDIKQDEQTAGSYLQKVSSAIFALKKLSKRDQGNEVFKRYRGVKGWEKMFGNNTGLSNDDRRERYW